MFNVDDTAGRLVTAATDQNKTASDAAHEFAYGIKSTTVIAYLLDNESLLEGEDFFVSCARYILFCALRRKMETILEKENKHE